MHICLVNYQLSKHQPRRILFILGVPRCSSGFAKTIIRMELISTSILELTQFMQFLHTHLYLLSYHFSIVCDISVLIPIPKISWITESWQYVQKFRNTLYGITCVLSNMHKSPLVKVHQKWGCSTGKDKPGWLVATAQAGRAVTSPARTQFSGTAELVAMPASLNRLHKVTKHTWGCLGHPVSKAQWQKTWAEMGLPITWVWGLSSRPWPRTGPPRTGPPRTGEGGRAKLHWSSWTHG